jgi:phage terminase small subunit
MAELTPKQALFVREYLIDLNATAAARRAGYKGTRFECSAKWLLSRPHITAAIDAALAERAERTQITADMVLERWWQIATADPNDVVQFRRNACRYCHGDNHMYQWRDVIEYTEACEKARDRDKPEPKDDGGYGFDANDAPNPDCPRCNGNGYGFTHISDTRKLNGPAKLIYAGVKETRDGVEVKLADQAKALENVARHLGMFKERVEHSGPNGSAIQVEQVQADAESFTRTILSLSARAAESEGTGEADAGDKGAT